MIQVANKYIKKMRAIRAKHLFVLLLLLMPISFIGINNYFFASSSFHYFANPENPRIITMQWVGDTDGLYMMLILAFIITALWLICFLTGKLGSFMTRFSQLVLNFKNFIKTNPKKAGIHAVIIVAIILASIVIVSITVGNASYLRHAKFAGMLFFAAVGFSIYFIAIFHGNVARLYLLLSLVIGFVYIGAHPDCFYAWDNNIHYAWALEESFVKYVSITHNDIALASNHTMLSSSIPAFDGFPQPITAGELATVQQYLKGPHTLAMHSTQGLSLYHRLAHIPAGIMIYIGRSLAIAPIIVVAMGHLGNLFMFSFVVYFAIKRLNSGKHIMAIIAMFPTVIIMSTTYTYDYWMIAFLMLGFAYFFNEIQTPGVKIKVKSIIIIIGSFVIGMAPRIVYSLFIGFLFCIKRDKFNTKKCYYLYLVSVTFGVLFTISSFIVPRIVSGVGTGDMRGGDDINAGAQIAYILNNPLQYTRILLDQLRAYLNVFIGTNYVTNFSHPHLGFAPYFYLVWMLLLFVMFTDRNEKDMVSGTVGYKVIVSIIAFSTVSLIITALYMFFTPVGASTLLGVQPRYMLPVIFPILYILGSFKIKNNINKTGYTVGVFSIMSFVSLYGVWDKLILRLGS